MILLAAEQRLTAPAIAKIVREDDQTVRNWLKRYLAEGIEGLKDRPMPGAPPKVTKEYAEQLLFVVRRRPRSLGSHTPCGPSNDWPIIWRSKRAFGYRMKPCASCSKRGRSCSRVRSTRSAALIQNTW